MAMVDRSTEHFELDFGGRRITHVPTGDTCLRQPYMQGTKGYPAWKEKFDAFVARHPGCHVVVRSNGVIIDDMRRSSMVGGGYSIGEHVAIVDPTTGYLERVLEIVASRRSGTPDSDLHPGDDRTSHLLENGESLWWDEASHGWFTRDREGDRNVRVRPLLPDEDPVFASWPAADMLRAAIPLAARTLTIVACGWRTSRLFPEGADDEVAELNDRLLAAADRMETANGSLRPHERDGPAVREASEALDAASRLLSEIGAMDLAGKSGVMNFDDGFGDLPERLSTIASTMRARGVLPSEPEEEPEVASPGP